MPTRPNILLIAILPMLLMSACSKPREYPFSGKTMGTSYHIKVVSERSMDQAKVRAEVDQCLERVNQSMSTYRPDSEISRFNAMPQADTPFKISPDFLRVMLWAREIYRLTGGAWDGTVNPLVNLWGFGPKGPLQRMPSPDEVATARLQVGFDHIEIDSSGFLIKKRPDVTLDLASIAKGYGVDQVAISLKSLGFRDFLVEIGGEIFAAGRRMDGKPWRVGINRPQAEAAADEVYKVVPLMDSAMATSGDYRNYVQLEGRTFSHVIDPRTGYPIRNWVVSASVIADNCTLADGLATALMVMGATEGIDLLDRLKGVEGLIIVRSPDGNFQNYFSKGMAGMVD